MLAPASTPSVTHLSIDSRGAKSRLAGSRCRFGWLLSILLAMTTATAQPLPPALLAVDFDGLAQGRLPPGVAIRTQFAAPDVVPGVVGTAWRSDGFSSYAEAALALDAGAGFTV